MLKKIPLLLILFLSILVVLPFFQPGLPETHDGVWVPVRLAEMIRELKDWQIPPRMSGYLNHGYGYPLFNFVYPFPYYLGTLFYLAGFGLVGSTKLLFAVSVPLSAVFMYFLAKDIWKSRFAGTISAVLYIFLPYRIVDLYARGSIGESLSFVLFPLIVWLAIKNKPLSLALAIAVLITTHNIMAVLFLPVFFVLMLALLNFQLSAIRSLLPAVVLGFGLSAFFWLPALWEKNLIALSKTPIADRSLYFVKPLELILPKWGYGLPTNPDGFGYQLGIPQVLAFVTATILAIIKKARLPITLICLVCLMLFPLFPISAPLWQLPFLKEINYPWTLLAPIGFLMSLLAGFLASTKLTRNLAILLAILAIFLCLPQAVPQSRSLSDDAFYQTNDATTTSSDELMPIWVEEKPTQRPDNIAKILDGEGTVKLLKDSSDEVVLQADLTTNSFIQVNKIFYNDWTWRHRSKDNKALWLVKTGLVALSVPQGNHVIVMKFVEPWDRQIANTISIVSLLILVFLATKTLWSKRSLQ